MITQNKVWMDVHRFNSKIHKYIDIEISKFITLNSTKDKPLPINAFKGRDMI